MRDNNTGKVAVGATLSVLALLLVILILALAVAPDRSTPAIVTPAPTVDIALSGNEESTLPRCEPGVSFNSLAAALEKAPAVCQLSLQRESVNLFLQNIDKFPNIKILHLPSHNLSSFPPELTRLSSLVILNLANNNIRSLPKEVATMQSLRYIFLRGNPVTREGVQEVGALMPRTKIVF